MLCTFVSCTHFLAMAHILESTVEPTLEKAEMVAVIGPAKSGKTTYIKHLLDIPLLNRWQHGQQGSIEPMETSTFPSQPNPTNHGLFPEENWQIWEFSGFENDEQVSEFKQCLSKCQNVRFVLVVPHQWVLEANESGELFKLLFNLHLLFPELKGSVCLVCTNFSEEWMEFRPRWFYDRYKDSVERAVDDEINDCFKDFEYVKIGKGVLEDIFYGNHLLYFKIKEWVGTNTYLPTKIYGINKIKGLTPKLIGDMKLN